jgi:hypothetical protein
MNFSCVDTCLVPIRYIQHGNVVMEQRVKCLRGHLRSPSYVHQDVLGLSPLGEEYISKRKDKMLLLVNMS